MVFKVDMKIQGKMSFRGAAAVALVRSTFEEFPFHKIHVYLYKMYAEYRIYVLKMQDMTVVQWKSQSHLNTPGQAPQSSVCEILHLCCFLH